MYFRPRPSHLVARPSAYRENATAMECIGNSVAVEDIIGIDCYERHFLDAGRVAFVCDSQRMT